MSIFGNEDAIEIEPTRVVKNSLGIDLGTLNTVIAKPSGDKFDLYQIPSVVAVKKDDPSAGLAVGEVIDNYDLLTRIQKFHNGMRTDKAGSARNQNSHGHFLSFDLFLYIVLYFL